jgi:hypothetical protein
MIVPVWKYVEGKPTKIAEVSVDPTCNSRLYTWYKHPQKHQIYATALNGKRCYLQDIVMFPEKGRWVHANGDPWDFCKNNLVNGTAETTKTKGTSKTVGVCYVKSRDRWMSTIGRKLIGYFKTEEEATEARVRALTRDDLMERFVKEGENPHGLTGMQTYGIEAGVPDAYIDLDDVESRPIVTEVPVRRPDVHNVYTTIPPPS